MYDDPLLPVFYPYAYDRLQKMSINGGRLVHYCSAEAAVGIIRNRSVWMRNAACMNDFMEVEHGLISLATAYNSDVGKELKSILDEDFDGVCSEIEDLFNSYQSAFRDDTYITCVSEHLNEEDEMGRLSMWRAYGRATGVALVMNSTPFRSPTNLLRAYSSPVRYAPQNDLVGDMKILLQGVKDQRDLLQSRSREYVQGHLFNVFRWAALATKHPGFSEEREWRVIYSPSIEKSDVLEQDVQTIGGVPQTIYKIPLKRFEGTSFSTAIPELIDRIIIGPTDYPGAMRDAFIALLADAGVDEPEKRIYASDIPLRQ